MRAASSRPMPPWIAPTTKLRRAKLCASELEVNFCFTASVYAPHAHQAEPVEHGHQARDDGEEHDREQYLRRDGPELYERRLGAREQRGDHDIGNQDSGGRQPVEPEVAPWEANLNQFDDYQRE